MTTESLHRALLGRLAAGWITLGVPLGGPTDPTLIDPEALVVMTALHGHAEPRLYDGAVDWCAGFGSLVNGARLRTVAREIDADPGAIDRFAALVAGAGGPRWPVLHGPPVAFETRRKTPRPDLRSPGALAVRLRAQFGVAVRADLIAVLATLDGTAPSIAELATIARSSKRNVALAVDTLRLGGVVEVDLVGNQQRVRLTPDPAFHAWLGDVPEAADWATRSVVIESVGVLTVQAARLLDPLHTLFRNGGLDQVRLSRHREGRSGDSIRGRFSIDFVRAESVEELGQFASKRDSRCEWSLRLRPASCL